MHEDAAYHDAIAMLNDRLCTFFEEFSDPRYDIWKGGRPKVTEYRLALFRRLFGQDWSTVSDSVPPFTEDVPPTQRR